MTTERLETYLERLIDALKTIEKYTKSTSFVRFDKDGKTIDACMMQLVWIGEVSRRIEKYYPRCKILPFKHISGLRNHVAHDYLGVDSEIIWKTIKDDLPDLKKDLTAYIDSLRK